MILKNANFNRSPTVVPGVFFERLDLRGIGGSVGRSGALSIGSFKLKNNENCKENSLSFFHDLRVFYEKIKQPLFIRTLYYGGFLSADLVQPIFSDQFADKKPPQADRS
jgi:hypothetical protein